MLTTTTSPQRERRDRIKKSLRGVISDRIREHRWGLAGGLALALPRPSMALAWALALDGREENLEKKKIRDEIGEGKGA